MSRIWLSIRVELVEGRGEILLPRPGREFAASRSHTFAELAGAIDAAFARWDLSHLHEFRLKDGARIAFPDDEGWADADKVLDYERTKLSRLALGEQFSYTFDLGDGWLHLCTVGPAKIDPLEALGIAPDRPLPYFGWGIIPDQYGRRWNGDVDDGDEPPPDPQRADLPPLEPGWGERDDHVVRPVGQVRFVDFGVSEVEVVLREADRDLLLHDTMCDPELVERLSPGPIPGEFMARYTPAELDDLIGFVAAESNHTRSKSLRASLDDLYARLEVFEDRAQARPLNPPS